MFDVELFRKARLAGGFTFREVATLAEVDPSTIAAYEMRKGNPSLRTAEMWKSALFGLLEQRLKVAGNALTALGED